MAAFAALIVVLVLGTLVVLVSFVTRPFRERAARVIHSADLKYELEQRELADMASEHTAARAELSRELGEEPPEVEVLEDKPTNDK